MYLFGLYQVIDDFRQLFFLTILSSSD